MKQNNSCYLQIKYNVDFIISLLSLIIISPIILIIYFLVYIDLGKPIFYKQDRPGYKGKVFTIYKFRTMYIKEEVYGNTEDDLNRISKFGNILRKSSLDELPQLINIIKGEMSFIGPRPLRKEYLEQYTEKQFKRHNVRPGITGYSQTKGRNNLGWDNRFSLDYYYVKNVSFLLDLRILIKTIIYLFNTSDVEYKKESIYFSDYKKL